VAYNVRGSSLPIRKAKTPTVLKVLIGSSSFRWTTANRNIHVRREDKAAKFWLDPVALDKADRFNP
jgi:hypothetical protein